MEHVYIITSSCDFDQKDIAFTSEDAAMFYLKNMWEMYSKMKCDWEDFLEYSGTSVDELRIV